MAFFSDSEIYCNEQPFYLSRMTTGLSEAISQGLRCYLIGEKLRSMRLSKGMGLGRVGQAYGAFRGPARSWKGVSCFPLCPPYCASPRSSGVGLDSFFSDERKPRAVGVVQRAERVHLPDRPATQDVQYSFECLDYRATEQS